MGQDLSARPAPQSQRPVRTVTVVIDPSMDPRQNYLHNPFWLTHEIVQCSFDETTRFIFFGQNRASAILMINA
jgi:hypothetical protein